ncbi:branched-chain amino acid ABC transporter permease [Salinibacterium sp. NG253]|uniref:branched-chain amino acid ABC transporter permease n=1 Tax=Salinibacterium sp. NG253 TaxID=2792039 RepID=UPI0018CD744C|nr:branched-chain amino acid ABC transporter permease [Salinibacterium sp. NG253]MBH0116787.1 branched-chain amino acid ABC transporter permease [Salinibacterium sp. NG253]
MLDVIIYGLLAGGVLSLVAVGLTLIFGIMDITNFAHGEFMMLGMLGTATVSISLGVSPYVAVLLVAIAGIVMGVVIHFVIIKQTLGKSLYVQVFATFGLSILLQSIATMIFGTKYIALDDPLASSRVNIFGTDVEAAKLIAFVVGIALVIGIWFWLNKTRQGREIRAVAQDTYAARVVGIRPGRAYVIIFTVGVVFAVIAGGLVVPSQIANAYSGTTFTLISFVIVVLGGFGSVPGALVGGLSIGLVQAFTGVYIGTQWQQASIFVIFVLVLLLRPQGLFGRKSGDSALVGGHE